MPTTPHIVDVALFIPSTEKTNQPDIPQETHQSKYTVQRLLNNEQHYGDALQLKTKDILQLYLQNIQGIPTTHNAENFHAMLNTMIDLKVNIFGWFKANIEWNDYKLNLKLFPNLF